MRKRNLIIVFVMLLALGAGGYYGYTTYFKSATPTTTATTQTATVSRGTLIATIAGAGQVSAKSQVSLNFGTGGNIKQVYVKVGDNVKQGQVLAEVNATDLQYALANAQLSFNQQMLNYEKVKAGADETDLALAQLKVDDAQANYELAVQKANLNDEQLTVARLSLDKAALSLQKAQAEHDKAVSERKTDLTTEWVQLQQAKLDYQSAQANYNIQMTNINDSGVRGAANSLAQAKASLLKLQNSPTTLELQSAETQVEQARLTLSQAQTRLRDAQLIAPFDGVITQVNIDNYSAVSASTAAVQLADLKRLQVTVNLAEVDIAKVKLGQEVNITFDAVADVAPLKGVVDQIALVAVTTQNVVNYPVVIALSAPDAAYVKTGMTANVAIVVDKRENVLLAPNRAIRTQNRQKVVQVQSPTGNVQTVVQIGLQNESQSEITSGLKEGDKVIIQTTTTTQSSGGSGVPGGGPFGR